jgi:hypothetical protein
MIDWRIAAALEMDTHGAVTRWCARRHPVAAAPIPDVSQHLGHRKLDTTRCYYAREQTRIATQRYHDVLTRKRTAATRSRRRKPKAKPA